MLAKDSDAVLLPYEVSPAAKMRDRLVEQAIDYLRRAPKVFAALLAYVSAWPVCLIGCTWSDLSVGPAAHAPYVRPPPEQARLSSSLS